MIDPNWPSYLNTSLQHQYRSLLSSVILQVINTISYLSLLYSASFQNPKTNCSPTSVDDKKVFAFCELRRKIITYIVFILVKITPQKILCKKNICHC